MYQNHEKVTYGTRGAGSQGDRLGEIIRAERQHRQDGYLIQPLSLTPGDGSLPSWYPAHMVYPYDPVSWEFDPRANTYRRIRSGVAVGTTVTYHGSLDWLHGRYTVAAADTTPDGIRYTLAGRHGTVLENVRAESFTALPTGPKHTVRGLEMRVQAVRRQALLANETGDVPAHIEDALREIPGHIARNRPAEAEHYLLSLEVTTGCIDHDTFQRRAKALVINAGDDSWQPPDDTLLRVTQDADERGVHPADV
jgi:hypothetical protein